MQLYKIIFLTLTLMIIIGTGSAALIKPDYVISKGVSLTHTPENMTVSENKVVTTDLKTKGIDSKATVSKTPLSDIVASKTNSIDMIKSKAQYIADSNLKGTYKVQDGNDTIIIRIRNAGYNEKTGFLQLNLSATVNGVEKRIMNPYKIYNPPILVQSTPDEVDKNGTIIKQGDFIEDPKAATIESIASVVKSLPDGKATFGTGDPTLTIYANIIPSPNIESPGRTNATETYTQLIVGSGNTYITTSTLDRLYTQVANSSTGFKNFRGGLSFNTSVIPSSYNETLLNVTLNLYGSSKVDQFSITPAIGATLFSPVNRTNFAYTDYNTNGTAATRFGSDISYASFSTTAYNIIPFTATGLSQVNRTGQTTVMVRLSNDIDSVSVTRGTSDKTSGVSIYTSNSTGTTKDPYLLVTYAVPGYQSESDFYTTKTISNISNYIGFYAVNDSYSYNYNWSFGDNVWANDSGTYVEHTYSANGQYSPSLYLVNLTSGAIVNSTTKTNYISIGNVVIYPLYEYNSPTWFAGDYLNDTIEDFQNKTWNEMILESGNALNGADEVVFPAINQTNRYIGLSRTIYVFNTSEYPAGTMINDASITFYTDSNPEFVYLNNFSSPAYLAMTNVNGVSWYDPTLGVNETAFNKNGTTELTSRILDTSIPLGRYNRYNFTSGGISNINTSGYTFVMTRSGWDVDSSEPSGWQPYPEGIQFITIWDGVTDSDVFLTVNYSVIPIDFTANHTEYSLL